MKHLAYGILAIAVVLFAMMVWRYNAGDYDLAIANGICAGISFGVGMTALSTTWPTPKF